MPFGQPITERFRTIARWRSDRLGEVYTAEESYMPGSLVSIRLFFPELLSSDIQMALDDLADHVRGFLPDPDLITGYSSFSLTDGRYALVSGFSPGKKLDELIIQEAPLSSSKALALLIRVAEITANLHAAGWVHGNISPENILVVRYDKEDGNYLLKLLDFGLTRTIAQFGPRALSNSAGKYGLRNYDAYFAPELLASGTEPVDVRADLYALGALCYHILSGHVPFTLDPTSHTGPVYMTDDPRPLMMLHPELQVPKRLEELMLSLLNPDRWARPSSLTTVVETLQDIQLELSLEVKGVGSAQLNPRTTGTLSQRIPAKPYKIQSGIPTIIEGTRHYGTGSTAEDHRNHPTARFQDPGAAGDKSAPLPFGNTGRAVNPNDAAPARISAELPPESFETRISVPLAPVPVHSSHPAESVLEANPIPISGHLPPESFETKISEPLRVGPPVAPPVLEPLQVTTPPVVLTPSPAPLLPPPPLNPKPAKGKAPAGGNGVRWGIFGVVIVLAVLITIGTIVLYTTQRPQIGNLTIVADPPGALVYLDGKPFKPSPTRLQNVPAGTHKLRFTKEGFTDLEKDVVVENGQTLEVSVILEPVKVEPPPVTGTPTERVAEFLRLGEESFGRNDLVIPENNNALYFADAVLAIQPTNETAKGLRNRILETLVKQAESAAKTDLATAQIGYTQISEKFPDDPRGPEGLKKVALLLEQRRGQITELLASGESAFTSGKLLDPPNSSAYYYSAQVLAIDKRNAPALTLRNKIKETLRIQAEQAVTNKDYPNATAQFQRLVRAFPEDRRFSVRIKEVSDLTKVKKDETNPASVDPKQAREAGMQKFRSGDYTGAITDLEKAVRGGMAEAETFYALGYSHLKRGQTGEARQNFNQAVQVNSNHGPSLGQLAVLGEQTEKAIPAYERAIRAGGGGDYSVATLQQKLDALKAATQKTKEPAAYSTVVTREEGGVFGSKEIPGTLTVSPAGLRFTAQNGKDNFQYQLAQVSELRSEGDRLFFRGGGKSYKFRCSSGTTFIQNFNACLNFSKGQ
ncbi:MAG: PEGA domain-containing protein [Blastocatellia bacterium]|nr:PEGA domain-containing protein [Blastocatellia bacterium]